MKFKEVLKQQYPQSKGVKMAGIFDKKNKKVSGFLSKVAKSAGGGKKPEVKLKQESDIKMFEKLKEKRQEKKKKMDTGRIKGIFDSFRNR